MKGTVTSFYRNRGFGFIKPEKGGKKVLVHWSNVKTDDKWPYIKRGTEVQFQLVKKDENGKRSAKNVTLVGGKKIPVHIPDDSDRISNDEDVYSGTIKFFDFRKGFGVIKPDEEIEWEDITSKNGVFFSRAAIVSTEGCKGMFLSLWRGTKVTFKVYKDAKGLGAHELQNEEGNPFEYKERKARKGGKKRKRSFSKGKKKPAKKAKVVKKKAKVVKKTKEELLEEREIDEEENIYTGTVKYYNQGKGYGFITIENAITFDDLTASGKIYVMKEDIVCYSDEVGMNADTKVIFKVYKDSMGIGAYEVTNEDGTPILFEPAEEQEAVEDVAKEKSPEPAPAKPKRKPSSKKASPKEVSPKKVSPKKVIKKRPVKKKVVKKKVVEKKTTRRTKRN